MNPVNKIFPTDLSSSQPILHSKNAIENPEFVFNSNIIKFVAPNCDALNHTLKRNWDEILKIFKAKTVSDFKKSIKTIVKTFSEMSISQWKNLSGRIVELSLEGNRTDLELWKFKQINNYVWNEFFLSTPLEKNNAIYYSRSAAETRLCKLYKAVNVIDKDVIQQTVLTACCLLRDEYKFMQLLQSLCMRYALLGKYALKQEGNPPRKALINNEVRHFYEIPKEFHRQIKKSVLNIPCIILFENDSKLYMSIVPKTTPTFDYQENISYLENLAKNKSFPKELDCYIEKMKASLDCIHFFNFNEAEDELLDFIVNTPIMYFDSTYFSQNSLSINEMVPCYLKIRHFIKSLLQRKKKFMFQSDLLLKFTEMLQDWETNSKCAQNDYYELLYKHLKEFYPSDSKDCIKYTNEQTLAINPTPLYATLPKWISSKESLEITEADYVEKCKVQDKPASKPLSIKTPRQSKAAIKVENPKKEISKKKRKSTIPQKIGKTIINATKVVKESVTIAKKFNSEELDDLHFAKQYQAITQYKVLNPTKKLTHETMYDSEPPYRFVDKRISKWDNAKYPLPEETFSKYQGPSGVSEKDLKILQLKQIQRHQTIRAISHRYLTALGTSYEIEVVKGHKIDKRINYIVCAVFNDFEGIRKNGFLTVSITDFGVCIHSTLTEHFPRIPIHAKDLKINSTKITHVKNNRYTLVENLKDNDLQSVEIRDHKLDTTLEIIKTVRR